MAPQQGEGSHGAKTDGAVAAREMGGAGGGRPSTWSWACWACVAAAGLTGAGVLVWWAVAFHPAHEQLWMVPVGIVLLGTPLIACLSLLASGACHRLGTSHQPPRAER